MAARHDDAPAPAGPPVVTSVKIIEESERLESMPSATLQPPATQPAAFDYELAAAPTTRPEARDDLKAPAARQQSAKRVTFPPAASQPDDAVAADQDGEWVNMVVRVRPAADREQTQQLRDQSGSQRRDSERSQPAAK